MFLLLRVWLHGVVKGSKLRLALGRPRRLYTMGFYTRGCDPADKIHTLTSLDDVGNCMGSYYKLEILFQLFKKTDKTFDMKYAWLSEGCMITVTMPNHAMFCLSLVTFLLLYHFSPSYYFILSSHVMPFKLWNIFQIIKTSQQPFYFLQTNHSSISSHDNWVNDWISWNVLWYVTRTRSWYVAKVMTNSWTSYTPHAMGAISYAYLPRPHKSSKCINIMFRYVHADPNLWLSWDAIDNHGNTYCRLCSHISTEVWKWLGGVT